MKTYSRDTQRRKMYAIYYVHEENLKQDIFQWVIDIYCTSQHLIFLGSSKTVTMAVVTAGHLECRLGDGPGNGCGTRFELWGAGQVLPLGASDSTCEGSKQCPLGRRVMSPGGSRHEAPAAVQGSRPEQPRGHQPTLVLPIVFESISRFFFNRLFSIEKSQGGICKWKCHENLE